MKTILPLILVSCLAVQAQDNLSNQLVLIADHETRGKAIVLETGQRLVIINNENEVNKGRIATLTDSTLELLSRQSNKTETVYIKDIRVLKIPNSKNGSHIVGGVLMLGAGAFLTLAGIALNDISEVEQKEGTIGIVLGTGLVTGGVVALRKKRFAIRQGWTFRVGLKPNPVAATTKK